MMKDFYRMADELRALLLAMYPSGYVKTERGKDVTTFYYRNFSDKPIFVRSFQVSTDGNFKVEVI